MGENTTPTIALLTHDTSIHPPLKAVTDQLKTDLIVVQSVEALLSVPVNLIFWFPSQFDDQMHEQLQRICPHVLVFFRRKPYNPEQRMGAGSLITATCLFNPFDPEEISIIVSSRLKTPQKQP